MESFSNEYESASDNLERNNIRSELSKMSFEDLQILKVRLGHKMFKEALNGRKSSHKIEFKRVNKNRPREVSSKVKSVIKTKVKEKPILDPRFNRLCGTFNEKHFQNSYGFLKEIREKEKVHLKKLLRREKNPNEASKIRYLLQRMENQERAEMKKQKEMEKKVAEKEEQIQAFESGKKPYFRNKYEKKMIDLVDKYTELKNNGKIQKYIQKKQRKQKIKEKKKRYFEFNLTGNNSE